MTLNEQELIKRLQPRPVRYFSQIGSTNDVALEWMNSGTAKGSIVVADEQIKGKGRLGRVWHTPPGTALIVSVILHPQAHDLGQITMLGALAIYDMVKSLGIESVGIKWPNDVMLNGLKVSGILPEAVWERDRLVGVVLGMGINVRIDFSKTELINSAISIEPVLGRQVKRVDLLVDLLARVDYWSTRLGSDELFTAWRNRLITLGQDVRVKTADKEVTGLAQDVERYGALLIRRADGQIERVIAGDIALG
ncbi:MAG: biotin--[acetyl-CoA-carboxylase] ligase [Anaerolineae bacterium]|nr:biotin--[acetyl-CoA-carboxylase] ligase [Anaerolineae bacterium]